MNLRHLLYRGRRGRLSRRQHGELEFWRRELDRYLEWAAGRLELYGVAPPVPPKDVDRAEAVHLFREKMLSHHGYPEQLSIPASAFEGMRVLDVGCGPLIPALGFKGCRVVALDELMNHYRAAGYPIAAYPGQERCEAIVASADDMPFPAASFDVVLSVNALDHVDDFQAVAAEILRVLRPGGVLALEVHFHEPTPLEPTVLDDDAVQSAFASLGIRKVRERRPAEMASVFPNAAESDRLVVWSNRA